MSKNSQKVKVFTIIANYKTSDRGSLVSDQVDIPKHHSLSTKYALKNLGFNAVRVWSTVCTPYFGGLKTQNCATSLSLVTNTF